MGRRTLKNVLMDIWEAVKVTWQGLSYQVKEVAARMGRRKMPDDLRRDGYLKVRMSKEELAEIEEIAEEHGMTKTDVMRYSLDLLKQKIRFRKKDG